MKRIIFTGGNGRFGKIFKNIKHKDKIFFPTKRELNIENIKSIETGDFFVLENFIIFFRLLPAPEIKTAVFIFLRPVNFSIKLNFIFS